MEEHHRENMCSLGCCMEVGNREFTPSGAPELEVAQDLPRSWGSVFEMVRNTN